jgi:hypothetical protein
MAWNARPAALLVPSGRSIDGGGTWRHGDGSEDGRSRRVSPAGVGGDGRRRRGERPGVERPRIRRLVAGRSASWVNASGYTGTITYLPNGVIQAKANVFGTSMNVGGTWSVRGDRFCRAMNMGPSGTSCQQVVRAGGGTYRFLNEDGSLATTTTFR